MTRLTSLVAVDKTPSRPEGEPLKVSELPINLPAGWDFAKLFGERPQLPATPRERRADNADARIQMAALKRANACGHGDARRGQAAEDRDLCRTEDDRWDQSCCRSA